MDINNITLIEATIRNFESSERICWVIIQNQFTQAGMLSMNSRAFCRSRATSSSVVGLLRWLG